MGCVLGRYPSDGFVISIEGPDEIPVFVRDSDLDMAMAASVEKRKSVSVTAVSWKPREGDSDGSGNETRNG